MWAQEGKKINGSSKGKKIWSYEKYNRDEKLGTVLVVGTAIEASLPACLLPARVLFYNHFVRSKRAPDGAAAAVTGSSQGGNGGGCEGI